MDEKQEALQLTIDLYDILESIDVDGDISGELSDCIYDIMENLETLRKCLKREIQQ